MSSVSSTHDAGPAVVDLTLERLHSLHTVQNTKASEELSSYARTGSSKTRVAHAVRHPICKCRCKVPLGILLKVVAAFWLLAKPTQDALLWSLQHEAGSNKKKQWFISGGRVCKLFQPAMKFSRIVLIMKPLSLP